MSSTEALITSQEFEFLRDGKQPEAGQILRKTRLAKGLSQGMIAAKLHCSRDAVQKWEQGDRWPNDARRDHLILLLAPQTRFATDKIGDTKVTQAELGALLAALNQAGLDEVDTADSMCTYAYPRVLSTLILRASGCPGVNVDSRAIALFFEIRDKVIEAKRLKGAGDDRNVTPTAKAWMEKRLKSDDVTTPTDSVDSSTSG